MTSRSETWARRLRCSKTGEFQPLDELATLSPAGAPWLVDYALEGVDGVAWRAAVARRPWSLWRYAELLPSVDPARRVDLGEGATPLVRAPRLGAELAGDSGIDLWIKEEGGNPTGSFKARGLSLAVNRARELGAPGVEMASAGNAALAVCAYAAAAELPARVALPEDTPPAIGERCRAYGAEVILGRGTLVEAAQRLADFPQRYFNVSTFREPYRVEGKKTMGLELAEQMDWDLPEWIVYPTGGGTGIVGMEKAFDELEAIGALPEGIRRPRFVVVQMSGCAPLVRAHAAGTEGAAVWEDPETRVWGLRVPRSLADRLILAALQRTGGHAVAVEEARLGALALAAARREGMLFGPEGAACLAAVQDLCAAGEMRQGDRVVVFQTGHPDNYGQDEALRISRSSAS